MTSSSKKPGGLNWRTLAIAAALIVIDNYWITVVEVRYYSLDGSCLPLYVTPIVLLGLLTTCNHLAWRLGLRALSQAELLVIYISMVVAAGLAGHDMLQNLFGSIGHAYWMATPENGWQQLFFRYLPSWLLVSDPKTLEGLYNGGASPYQSGILVHWLVPLLGWAVLLIILMAMMLAMNVIIRRHWIEEEKLTFPLVRLPMAMVETDSWRKLYTNRLMWIGFAVGGGVTLLNGLHFLFPNVPYLQYVKLYNLRQHISTEPWASVGRTLISMYPFAIGLGFFIPLDLSFSCWFFYVALKVFRVAGAVFGLDSSDATGFPYVIEQGSGAWIAFGLAIIWRARRYLAGVWVKARDPLGSSDPDEAVSYRWALVTLAVGSVALLAFSRLMGMKVWVAVAFFALYFLIAISITRVRAELGTPHELYFVHPQQILVVLFGPGAIGTASMVAMSTMYWYNRCYEAHPMPNQLESFKMADGKGISLRSLIGVLAFASVLGIIVTYWANLNVTYAAGGMATAVGFKGFVGKETYLKLTDWLTNWKSISLDRVAFMVVGFVIVLCLSGLRSSFIWWPFHPAGYALAVGYAIDYFWFPFFLAWLAKLILVRYGGIKGYNAATPFFLGLILGDYTIGALWSVVGALAGVQTYKIFN